MNNTNMFNQSKIKNSKVSFDISQINAQNTSYSDKDSMQNVSGLGTKFSYTDPLSQAYLNKAKKKPQMDKASYYSNSYAVPITETDITTIVDSTLKATREKHPPNYMNATSQSTSLRKQEKIQNDLRLQQKQERSRQQYVQEVQEQLSVNKMPDVQIEPSSQYNESLINCMNQARENLQNTEFKHSNLLDENLALKKQISILKDGIDLQNIRFKYYIQTAYNTLSSDSVFLLDQRLFHISVKNLFSELEPQKQNFNAKTQLLFDTLNNKAVSNGKQLSNLIQDNEVVLKFLDHDLNLEKYNINLPAETLEQIQSKQGEQQEAAIKTLNTMISEKILEIEKYRIADNSSRQLIGVLSAKSEEYEKHIQNMMNSGDKDAFKNNLKRVIELKRDNDILLAENEHLKKTVDQYQLGNNSLINENNLLQEKLIIYGKKLVQLLIDTNLNETAIKAQMDELLQSENIDFYLKKRNMEFIKEKYSENNETKRQNALQEQDIDHLKQHIEEQNQTIEQLEKKLIEQTKSNQIPALLSIDDTSQLQHTIQQLSLILLSKENIAQVDQTTLKILKQLFSENFDSMMEFQQETIDNLKVKLGEIEQKYYQSESKRIDYLNISFYLSNLLVEIIDSQKDANIRGRLQKERNQILNFYGKSVSDFQDLIKLQNPRNINPINQWYVNKLKDDNNGVQGEKQQGGEEKLKSQDDNILSDLTVLSQMGVKPLQEYLNMRIGKIQSENVQLQEKLQNIKKENVTVAELKRQRLADEERYERLSKKLQAFCQDNIFSASENNDLIGHYNEDFMLSLFIQANTIEEMINKTIENDDEEVNSRPSVANDNNQPSNANDQVRDSDVRNNQPPILNHSIIEEKPGEEDEYIENGKRGPKVRKSYKNLSSSQHSLQDSNHQREGSNQGFDQKIQINISISSPDKSHSSSFSGQVQQPIIETQMQRIPYYEENQIYQKVPQQSALSQKQYEEDLNYQKQFTIQSSIQGQDTDSLTSKSSGNVPIMIEESKQQQITQQQQKQQVTAVYQLQQNSQKQQQPQYQQQQPLPVVSQFLQQQISSSQTPSFKNTPKSTNNNSLSNIPQGNNAISQSSSNKQISNVEDHEPRTSKPVQYLQQEKPTPTFEERLKSNNSSKHSSIHSVHSQQVAGTNMSYEVDNTPENQRQQQMQRQKEIQELKRFSTQSTLQQFVDPTFKKRGSDSQIPSFNSNQYQVHQNQQQQQPQQLSQQTAHQVNTTEHRNQLSISRNSQDRQKLFQETIGQISDIKPTSKKMIDEDNKTSFNEDHFEILFGQRNNESIDNPYDNHSEEGHEEGRYPYNKSQQEYEKNNNQRRKIKTNYNQYENGQEEEGDDDGYAEDRESDYNNYEPNYEDDEYNQDHSNQYQDDEEQDDSLEQEAPYLNQE